VDRPPNAAHIRLRPHHLLCLVAFQGEGYSPKFIAQALGLQRALLAADTVVELVEGPDDLCDGCPEMKKECVSISGDAGVGGLDRAASDLLGIAPGRRRASELLQSLKETFSPERGYKICAGCSWLPRMDCPRVIAIRLKDLFPEIPIPRGGPRA
jgi:hypothetical protein